ncbi:Uncharacterised protein [Mycobacteroides abscessus subsp. abscessus]|nr:Uncharacterised protein [Mycobacteroides abscessus subsp. abscessus]
MPDSLSHSVIRTNDHPSTSLSAISRTKLAASESMASPLPLPEGWSTT